MSAADVALDFALSQVGKPYQYGATGPNSYDCSGLVQAAYKQAGINLGRVTEIQITEGESVAQSNLGPGDLVFPDVGHVQLYAGNGNVVEAPHTGANVRVVPMYGFYAGRRVTDPGKPVTLTNGSADVSDDNNSVTSNGGSSGGFLGAITSSSVWKRIGVGAAGIASVGFGVRILIHGGF